MDSDDLPQPKNSARVWRRRAVIGAAGLPLATAWVLHRMGRSGDFGVLGEWYVLGGLTVAGVLAWWLLEKAVERSVR